MVFSACPMDVRICPGDPPRLPRDDRDRASVGDETRGCDGRRSVEIREPEDEGRGLSEGIGDLLTLIPGKRPPGRTQPEE